MAKVVIALPGRMVGRGGGLLAGESGGFGSC